MALGSSSGIFPTHLTRPRRLRRVFSPIHLITISTQKRKSNSKGTFKVEMSERPPFPGRPAQPPGLTYLQYSPDGKRLLVAGCGNFARSFRTGDNDDPDMLPEVHDDTYALAAGNDYAILGCEDGTVCEYEVPSGDLKKMLVRTTLPIRSIALSPDEKFIAVSSEYGNTRTPNDSTG